MECLPSISQLASLLTSTSTSTSSFTDNTVDILALGSGWTGSFLIPIAQQANKSIQSTSRDGRDSTIQFNFDPDSDSSANFFKLPNAKTVVIIFPLYTTDSVLKLVRFYRETRQEGSVESAFLLLGSTGIWDNGPTFQSQPPPYSLISSEYLPEKKKPIPSPPSSPWLDRHSPYNSSNPRAQAEDQLLALSKPFNPISDSSIKVSILCLSGLWGHGRSPRRFVGLLANSKEKLKEMTSVHLVHGRDVARAVLAIHDDWDKTQGQRWLLTNERVYDLWDLASRFGNAGEAGRDKPPQGPQPQWIQELMFESLSNKDLNQRIRALPRSVEQMGKGLDGSEFWRTFGIRPEVPWVD